MDSIKSLPPPLRGIARRILREWGLKAGQVPTKKDITEEVRVIPPEERGISLKNATEAVYEAVLEAQKARRTRQVRRIAARLGIEVVHGPYGDYRLAREPVQGKRGRPPVRLPNVSLAERLESVREGAVLATYRRLYRTPAAGHGDEFVLFTKNPEEVGLHQTRSLDWELYRGRQKGRPAQVTNTEITVPYDWRVRIQRRGLDNVDGMMTLDAQPLDGAPDGVKVYAATWIVQGKGYSVSAINGFIAIQGEGVARVSYHGETVETALRGLKRKAKAAEWEATLRTADIGRIVESVPPEERVNIQVLLSDAKAIGACDCGIASWCSRVGLNEQLRAGKATLEVLWDAYQRLPIRECRATILHALRRHKRLRLQAAA